MYIALEYEGFNNLKNQHVNMFEDYPTYLDESQADIVDRITDDISDEDAFSEYVEYVICELTPVSVSRTVTCPQTTITDYHN